MSSSSSFFGTGDVASWWLDKDDTQDDDNPFKAEENEKDCTIFVIDCNEFMFKEMKMKSEDNEKNNNNNDNLSIFASVCKAIENALKRKIIKSKDDLVCFILFNTLETKNAMKLSSIYLLSEPDSPSAKLIKQIRDLPTTFNSNFNSLKNNKQCEFRDLLWTLQNIFSEVDVKGTKYGSKRAFIFTNNDNPLSKDSNATYAKAQDMLNSGMEISVFPLAENFTIKKFYSKICTFNLDEITSEHEFKQYCPTLDDLEDDLRVKEMKKRSVASVPLTIGPNFKMAVKMYSLYKRATKESPQWLDSRTNQPLTVETRWICQDTGQILDDSQIRTYHEYGPTKERIYFTKDEMKKLKTFGTPSLTLMGFKPIEKLKPYYQYKPSQFIYPDEERCIGSTLAMDALIKAMIELKQYAVCRYIFRKVSVPRFVALVPQQEEIDTDTKKQLIPPGMNMIFLPYADDIRSIDPPGIEEMKRADIETNEDHAKLSEKCEKIIDKLLIEEMIQPTNVQLQGHYDALEALALEQLNDNDDAGDEDGDDDMKGPLNTEDEIMPDDAGMLDAARKEIEEFLQLMSELGEFDASSDSKPKTTRKRKAADSNQGGAKKRKTVKRKASDSNGGDLNWKQLAENDELKSLKVKELKVYLSENGLKMSGKKADLIKRINEHLGV